MILKINGDYLLDSMSGLVFVTVAHFSLHVRSNCFKYNVDECQSSKGKNKNFNEKDLSLKERFVASW